MTLKELVLQTSFEDVTAEYKKTLHAHGIWFHEEEEQFLSNIFRKVKTMEPVEHKDRSIWAGRFDVSAMPGGCSLIFAPWKDWIGMEIDADLLRRVKPASIVANCFYEMAYMGGDEEEREKKIEKTIEKLGGKINNEEDKEEEDPFLVTYTPFSDPLRNIELDICKIKNGVAVIHDGVTEIPDKYFRGMDHLKSVSIPDSVIRIGKSAFYCCRTLKSIVIPASVKEIGDNAFLYTRKVNSIVVSEDNKRYDSRNNSNAIIETSTNRLILGCNNTIIPDTVVSIGEYAFVWYSFDTIAIPDSVKEIGKRAFVDCKKLTSIEIPNSVTTIGAEAFYNCTKLSSVVLPNSLTTIDESAFYGCERINTITIPDSVQVIWNHAFDGAKLKSIVWSKNLRVIGAEAFAYSSLKELVLPHNVTHIIGGAFKRSKHLSSVFIPASVSEIAGNVFLSCPRLRTIKVDEENKIYDSRNNCNAIIETATNTLIVGCKTTIIPDTVTEICDRAFLGCIGLRKIVIPESVTEIGYFAFSGCTNLHTIVFQNTVKMIWPTAFQECSSLNFIVIPKNTTRQFKKMLPEVLHSKIKEIGTLVDIN